MIDRSNPSFWILYIQNRIWNRCIYFFSNYRTNILLFSGTHEKNGFAPKFTGFIDMDLIFGYVMYKWLLFVVIKLNLKFRTNIRIF